MKVWVPAAEIGALNVILVFCDLLVLVGLWVVVTMHELQVAPEQDHGRLRELFDPKTIVWLAEHPLKQHVEYRAGFLVVYVPGYIEDLGRIVWLLEAAERIAGRVVAETGEAQAVTGG